MSILGKIFGRLDKSRPASMTTEDTAKIVQDYGAVLENTARTKQLVIDTSSLPYSKDRIKQALVLAIRSTTDSKMREHLKIGYIYLSNWQNGVGNIPVEWDFTRDDLNKDISGLLDRVRSQAPSIERWVQVVKAETESLKSELQQLGLW